MKSTSRGPLCLCIPVVALAASLLSARAQIPWATEPYSRQNQFEVYGVGEYLHQGNTTYNTPFGNSVTVKMDDTGMGGFGLAYHFSDYISVHSDFLFGPATFHAEGPGGPSYTLGQNGFLQSGRVNLDYNIINRRLTPFITGGIGYQYMQVEYPHYYYDNYYSEADFTWNVGGGIRWTIVENLFIKLTAGAQWLQYQHAENITTQFEAAFAIGFNFR